MIVHDSIEIHAPIDRLWALSTRVELVAATLGMRLLPGGVTRGHIEDGSRVLWKGWKFGLPTRHSTLITGFQPPETSPDRRHGLRRAWFQDSQMKGRFRTFHHDHWFTGQATLNGQPLTVLRDEVHFSLDSVHGGEVAALILLGPYVRKLVRQRFHMLKQLAEGNGWRQWIDTDEA